MFRPCIDLRGGKVVQLVGGTFTDSEERLQVHHVATQPARWFADLYRRDGLTGGHVIMLGPSNEPAAREALAAFPGGLQVGGGIHPGNAHAWLDAGASHVIVTSWIFQEAKLDPDRLQALAAATGKDRLVLDLSCRRRGQDYFIVTNRWQSFTDLRLDRDSMEHLAQYCSEFLVHGVDVEGLRLGIDRELIERLAAGSPLPTTYAGGANSLQDLEDVTRIGRGRIDLTIGSALDLFGGTGVRYADVVAFNRRSRPDQSASTS